MVSLPSHQPFVDLGSSNSNKHEPFLIHPPILILPALTGPGRCGEAGRTGLAQAALRPRTPGQWDAIGNGPSRKVGQPSDRPRELLSALWIELVTLPANQFIQPGGPSTRTLAHGPCL